MDTWIHVRTYMTYTYDTWTYTDTEIHRYIPGEYLSRIIFDLCGFTGAGLHRSLLG